MKYTFGKNAGAFGTSKRFSRPARSGRIAMTTSLSSSIVYRTVTATLDVAQPVGAFCNGDPCIVSQSSHNLTALSPAATLVSSYMAHGAMVDPCLLYTSPSPRDA